MVAQGLVSTCMVQLSIVQRPEGSSDKAQVRFSIAQRRQCQIQQRLSNGMLEKSVPVFGCTSVD